MKVMKKNLGVLFVFLTIFSLTFISCSGLTNEGEGGRIVLSLPGSSSRDAVRPSENELFYTIALKGPSPKNLTCAAGEQVVLENLAIGNYEICVDAFEKNTGYFFARGTEKTVVEWGKTANVNICLRIICLSPVITKDQEDITVFLSNEEAAPNGVSFNLNILADVNQRGGLTYAWYKVGDNASLTYDGASVKGFTETKAGTYKYRCSVKHDAPYGEKGSKVVTSRIVTVKVVSKPDDADLESISASYRLGEYIRSSEPSIGIDDFVIKETYSNGQVVQASSGEYEVMEPQIGKNFGNVPYRIQKSINTGINCEVVVPTYYLGSDLVQIEVNDNTGDCSVHVDNNVMGTVYENGVGKSVIDLFGKYKFTYSWGYEEKDGTKIFNVSTDKVYNKNALEADCKIFVDIKVLECGKWIRFVDSDTGKELTGENVVIRLNQKP